MQLRILYPTSYYINTDPCGVPQGSVLGPILFICFVNDMPDSIASFIYMCADDTKLFTSSRGQKVLQRNLNRLGE